MKMKNVNFFQKHAEKLILGGALLLAGLIVLIYAVGTPYSAEVSGRELGPTAIEAEVEQLAMQLDQGLKSQDSDLPPMSVPPYTEDFETRIARGIADGMFRVTLNAPGLDPQAFDPGQPPEPYDVPRPPPASGVVARAGNGVLGVLQDNRQQQALVQLIGSDQPQDFPYVSVAGKFNINDWQDQLFAATDLPSQFYRAMIGLAGVYLERQELDPVTGEWGNTTIIQPLPTQVGFLPQHTYDYTPQQADQILNYIRTNQELIARPEFPPLSSMTMWLPPFSDYGRLTDEQQREFDRLNRDIARLESQLTRLEEQMAQQAENQQRQQQRQQQRSQAQQRRPQPQMDDPMMDDPMMMDDPAMGGRFQQRPRVQVDRGSEMAQQYNRMQEDLRAAQMRRDELMGVPPDVLQGRFRDPMMMDPMMMDPMMDPMMMDPMMGGMMDPMMDPYAQQGRYGQQQRRGRGTQAQPGQELEDPGELTVWAHDLTVEPGKTYRYRLLVSVLNPLFRQTRVEENQRQEQYNRVALGPDTSALGENEGWTEPVRIDPEAQFFFVQGGQSPRVEIWRIYDGLLRRAEFNVQPGDPISGTMEINVDGQRRTIEMNVGAVVVDFTETPGGGTFGGDARMLYLAPGSDQIASRSAEEDRNSNDRLRLQNRQNMQLQQRQMQAMAQ